MRPARQSMPLTPFAIFLVLASAAFCVAQTHNPPEQREANRSVIASGRLLGNREVQQVLVSRTDGTVRLVIESLTSPRKIIWETNSRNGETKIDSVRLVDLDGDGIPELITLWWKGDNSVLRAFHWDTLRRAFAEIGSDEEIDKVHSYRIVESRTGRTKTLAVAASTESNAGPATREYALRHSRLVRTREMDTKATLDSGIEGQAIISPSHPGPIRQGESGTTPYKTAIVVWSTVDGREVARVETGTDGRFRIALKPGSYRVGPPQQTGRFLPRASEETVTVTAGNFAKVTINFDSGMR